MVHRPLATPFASVPTSCITNVPDRSPIRPTTRARPMKLAVLSSPDARRYVKNPVGRVLCPSPLPVKQPHHHPVLAHAAEILARVLGFPLSSRHPIRSRRLDDVLPLVVVHVAHRNLMIAPRLRVDRHDLGRR